MEIGESVRVRCVMRGCDIDPESLEAAHFTVEMREHFSNENSEEITLNKYDFWVCSYCMKYEEKEPFSLYEILNNFDFEVLRVVSSASLDAPGKLDS